MTDDVVPCRKNIKYSATMREKREFVRHVLNHDYAVTMKLGQSGGDRTQGLPRWEQHEHLRTPAARSYEIGPFRLPPPCIYLRTETLTSSARPRFRVAVRTAASRHSRRFAVSLPAALPSRCIQNSMVKG